MLEVDISHLRSMNEGVIPANGRHRWQKVKKRREDPRWGTRKIGCALSVCVRVVGEISRGHIRHNAIYKANLDETRHEMGLHFL
jgi:hypothetical protein